MSSRVSGVKVRRAIERALLQAYQPWIVDPERKAVAFRDITGQQLSELFLQHPNIVSPTLSCLNVERTEMERHLGFDAYKSTALTKSQATFLAGYAKSQLPEVLTIPAILARHQYSPAQSIDSATPKPTTGVGPTTPTRSPSRSPRSRRR